MNDASPPTVTDERVHAELGPSSSNIWLTCLQAPREWKRYPSRPSSYAAMEGTLAHTLCEAALLLHDIPWQPGQVFSVEGTEIPVTPEMLNAVQLYVNTTNLISDIALWRVIEKAVRFDWIWRHPPAVDLFGTADFAAADTEVLYVVDFKYGAGKFVKVEGNTQMLCYGVGAYGMLRQERPELAAGIEEVSLTVVQPRAGGIPVRQWNISIGDLLYWAHAVLKPSIDKILSDKVFPLVPGNHCYFCPASIDCPAYNKQRLEHSTFPDLTTDDMEALDKLLI